MEGVLDPGWEYLEQVSIIFLECVLCENYVCMKCLYKCYILFVSVSRHHSFSSFVLVPVCMEGISLSMNERERKKI